MYECLGCGKSNKPKVETIVITGVNKILCVDCETALRLGLHFAANKEVMRILSKFLDKELKSQKEKNA